MKNKLNWCIMFMIYILASKLWAKEIGVYLPIHFSAKSIEASLKSDPILHDYKVTVFARFKDFQIMAEKGLYDFVIVPHSFLKFQTNIYEPIYQLTKNGEKSFKYTILSLHKEIDQTRIEKGTLGMIEEVERRHIRSYLHDIIPNFKIGRSVQVTRVEDLYPLLALENADFVLVHPDNYTYFQDKYRSVTYKLGQSLEVFHPVIGQKKTFEKSNAPDFRKLKKESLESMSFDGLIPIGGNTP